MASETAPSEGRAERVLAYMLAGILLVAVLSILAILLAPLISVDASQYSTPLWQVILLLPAVGIPIAALLFIAILIISVRRRRRMDGTSR
ncbi:hypothetical protein [Clavibacter nebraskensis]|uniref:Integral membrane protein n=2 Tax=Clavibacter nebraskensis TaxID=31963 RepID=A0ABY4MN81_9MICO|nr:hypothetical protein [Clavibacter nebraskensis]KXU19895.1 hypothetical protein VV38_11710 [Clavibacter nebraskensis]OAH18444.1 hypothetical protein A3Q38_11465 [Clavibacter nebraskensis]QGV67500.1 hypothetical protein EGX36_12105 [Clavibacter nebraskensis]QGV70299.1 hypothetical protein EGX37_12060 [Clavibacter nebraskensis]QGV73090.1 hypothetical protein EGX35_12060 [Clavibacter nebraskensis]